MLVLLLTCCEYQEARKGMAAAGKVNVSDLEEKPVDDEPLVFANKQVRLCNLFGASIL